MDRSRRGFLAVSAQLAALSAALPLTGFAASKAHVRTDKRYSARAIDLVQAAEAVDLKHALTLHPTVLKRWLTDSAAFTDEDKAAFRSSGLKVIQTTLETVSDTLLDFAWHNGFVAAHSDLFVRIERMADLGKITAGRIGIIFGCENSDHFKTLDDVNLYYSLGQRVSQLTYNRDRKSVV